MNYHCYADDTQVYIKIEPRNDLNDVSSRLKACLNDIRSWMSVKFLKLNQDKTELMIFAPKNRLSDIKGFCLEFGDSVIHDVPWVKNLGVFFDTTLTMDKHCTAVSRACYFHLRNIGRIRPYITQDACRTLVSSLVTSRLDYGNALLIGVSKQHTERLQCVQNTAARIIERSKSKFDHITPVLIDLHWLPIVFRCQYKTLLYVFKALHGLAPIYLSELIQAYTPTRSLRSESAHLLSLPTTRTVTYGNKRFDKASATLWNTLPVNLRKCDSLVSFKRNLKTFLFKKAYF